MASDSPNWYFEETLARIFHRPAIKCLKYWYPPDNSREIHAVFEGVKGVYIFDGYRWEPADRLGRALEELCDG